ncbi:HAD hydrolase-like protein [Micromonospora chokoriensis]
MLPLPRTPHAVVFDLDGVLLDTTENMRCAFAAVWHAAGRRAPLPMHEFLSHMGAPLTTILAVFDLSPAYVPIYSAASTARADLIHPCAGAAELLRTLRDVGMPTAVATGKSRARALEALDSGGLGGLVDVVVGSDEVTHPKPAPDILLTALSRITCSTEPAAAVFVGDSVLDLRCGRAAGVPTVAAGWGQSSPGTLLAESPDAYAERALDLMTLLVPQAERTADIVRSR